MNSRTKSMLVLAGVIAVTLVAIGRRVDSKAVKEETLAVEESLARTARKDRRSAGKNQSLPKRQNNTEIVLKSTAGIADKNNSLPEEQRTREIGLRNRDKIGILSHAIQLA
eukprot:gnl/MRDRNA2_/MRDRNA2_105095_c0_seq1.p2 gnl/MRDRNA2_/MRDRNA2_105095_c0~~gnl/MRDRNA2_/MRDRNA2_105095_c0_seq1.p2  ORF type:complete len:111 (-),score=21.90 gnl/MRDRNA2_/MRDRNA2_105095_c0_seq1:246-578(-)